MEYMGWSSYSIEEYDEYGNHVLTYAYTSNDVLDCLGALGVFKSKWIAR